MLFIHSFHGSSDTDSLGETVFNLEEKDLSRDNLVWAD
jgi:hypothetical protein